MKEVSNRPVSGAAKARKFICFFASISFFCFSLAGGGSAYATALALEPLTIGRTDFLNNLPATNRYLFPGAYPSVEQDIWIPHAHDVVVYRRTDTISIELTIANTNPIPTVGTFKFINGVFTRGSGQSYNLAPVTQGITVPAEGTATVTVTLSGMPDCVTVGALLADVVIEPTYGMWLDSGLGYTVFRTESTPNWLQSTVWIEVLSDACYWAEGQTGGAAAVARDVTFGLNYNVVYVWDGGPSHYFKKDMFGTNYFLLKKFFDNRADYPHWTNGDCKDVSGYLEIVMAAIGLVGHELQQEWPFDLDEMLTNPLCPIGDDMTLIANYRQLRWVFHQIARWSGNVYDACASLVFDLNGDAYMNPPAGWNTDGWWQTPNPNWTGPVGEPYRYFGLVDGFVIIDWSQDPARRIEYPSQPVTRLPVPISIWYISTGDA